MPRRRNRNRISIVLGSDSDEENPQTVRERPSDPTGGELLALVRQTKIELNLVLESLEKLVERIERIGK